MLGEAEQDDSFINGPSSHNDLWYTLIKPKWLAGKSYNTVSRGRVVYERVNQRYVILATPEVLANAKAREAIKPFYALDSSQNCICWRDGSQYVTQPDLFDKDGEFGYWMTQCDASAELVKY